MYLGNGKTHVAQNLLLDSAKARTSKKPCRLRFSLHQFVHLKVFWTLFKNVHCQGPCSLRPCISRPYCIIKIEHLCVYISLYHWRSVYLKIWKGNVKCTNLFCYEIIFLFVKYCLDIVYDTFFYESAFYSIHQCTTQCLSANNKWSR